MSHIKGYLQFISEQNQDDDIAAKIKQIQGVIKGIQDGPNSHMHGRRINQLKQQLQDLKAEAAEEPVTTISWEPDPTTDPNPTTPVTTRGVVKTGPNPTTPVTTRGVVKTGPNPTTPVTTRGVVNPPTTTDVNSNPLGIGMRKFKKNLKKAQADWLANPAAANPAAANPAAANPAAANPPTTTVTNPAAAKPNTTTVTTPAAAKPNTTTVTTPAAAKPNTTTVTTPAAKKQEPFQMSSGRGNEALRARNIAKAKARKQNPTVNTKPTLNKAGTDSGSGVDALKQRMIKRSEERGK